MPDGNALSRRSGASVPEVRRSRHGERGAVFLLTVYFAALMLLAFGGLSLQRTVVETRAAEVSRSQRQAFYLAEGALDSVLQDLRQDITAVPDGQGTALSTGPGIAT